jgi:nitric oxide reductase subunit C
MLSKSQARLFFIVGTIFFSGIFLWLTIDTMMQVPDQTNANNITPEVDRGKRIWEKNNCMGCHTLFGEGAYYAPELTKAYERRGEAWLRVFLRDPEAMFPGERKMTNYNFTEDEISDVIAFLKWCGEVDLNGFPADPPLAPTTNVVTSSSESATEAPAVFGQLCVACHSVAGKGGNVGPALDGVGSRMDEDLLFRHIKDPLSVKADSKMPNLGLADNDIREIVSYLKTLN